VPFFAFDQRVAVSGAQPAELLLGVLDKAWSDRALSAAALSEGATCGPAGCT
jgi:predicted DsbA family dithiol-disulfide isomerase